MEILLVLIIFGFGMGFGWNLREKVAEQKIKKVLQQLEDQVMDEEEETRIPVTIEMVGNQFMVYDMLSGQFMAQGNTWAEIEQRLTSRYPGKKFQATREDLEMMGIKL